MSDSSPSTGAAAAASSADDILRSVAAEQAQHDAQTKLEELKQELEQRSQEVERLTSEKKELGVSRAVVRGWLAQVADV